MDEIMEVGKALGTILAEVLIALYFCHKYIKQATAKFPIGPGVKAQAEIDLKIIKEMDYYKELLKADRVLLFEFHNGQHYSNYRSALKMSASYEVYRAGLTETAQACSGIPIASMPHFVSAITNEGYVICKDLEDIKNEMGSSYNFKKALGIKSFYDVALRDKENNVIGFVAVQWNGDMPEDITAQSVERLAWYLEECIKELTDLDKKVKTKKKFLFFK